MRKYRKLGRKSGHRMMMFRNMTTSLIQSEKIVTTVPRAKELRKFAEKMVTLAKAGDLHSRRQVLAFMTNADAIKKLYEEIAPKYESRSGGYTRIVNLGPRRGDAAPMCRIEFV